LTQAISQASDRAWNADPIRFSRGAYEVIIGRALPEPGMLSVAETNSTERENCVEIHRATRIPERGEVVATVLLKPKDRPAQQVVIWVDGDGKQAIFDNSGKPNQEVARLLRSGVAVVGVDLIGQGESKVSADAREENLHVKEDRNFAAYTYGYNSPLFVQRVHDIMTVIAAAHAERGPDQRICLVGVHGAGPLVAAAVSQAGDAVDAVAIDTEGFRFAQLTDFADARFLPGAVKYGDLPGLLVLLGKRPVWLAGESGEWAGLLEAFLGNARAGGVTLANEKAEDKSSAMVDWLLSEHVAK
jgi:hypothetical protein